MSTLKKISNTVKSLLNRKDTQLPGFLGNLSGTVKADDANNVYVTLFGGEVRVVYNGKVPNVPRLPVIIGYAPGSNQLEVLGARDVFTKPPYPEVPPHAMLHTFPGADTIPIRGEQFLPGLITPAGGLTVKVYGMAYQIGGVWYVLATQVVDLTAEVPASGALMALLQVDDTGTINITAGTAVDSRSELGFDDIPAGDADQYTLGAVKLYNGQDRILFTVTDTDIVDLRWGREGGGGEWGSITGTLSAQTDLKSALDAKEASANKVTTMTGNTTSNIVFLTAKAINDWAIGLFSQIGHTHTSVELHNVFYIPDDNADWTGGVDPGTAGDGMDQLAQRVTDLEAGGGGGGFASDIFLNQNFR